MRVLLADDEPIALERLQMALACVPDAELVAKAKNGKEALAFIRELKPDIAVLDIQMPVKDGFAAIEDLRPDEFMPEVIFVTAYQEHAMHAFDVHAVDCLLKPVAFERFREALRRAKARLDASAADARFAELQKLIATLRSSGSPLDATTYEHELWVRTRGGLTRLPTGTIDYIAAEGDYVLLHVGDRSHLLKDTIISLQSRLDPAVFLRIHRSTIVNLKRIDSMRRRGTRALSLTVTPDVELAVGPSYVQMVLDAVHAKRWR